MAVSLRGWVLAPFASAASCRPRHPAGTWGCALSKSRLGGEVGDGLLWLYASVKRVMFLEFLDD